MKNNREYYAIREVFILRDGIHDVSDAYTVSKVCRLDALYDAEKKKMLYVCDCGAIDDIENFYRDELFKTEEAAIRAIHARGKTFLSEGYIRLIESGFARPIFTEDEAAEEYIRAKRAVDERNKRQRERWMSC